MQVKLLVILSCCVMRRFNQESNIVLSQQTSPAWQLSKLAWLLHCSRYSIVKT